MLRKSFKRQYYIVSGKPEEVTPSDITAVELPEGIWRKCPKCGTTLVEEELKKNLSICKKCGEHFRMTAWERIDSIVDPDSFTEISQDLQTVNPLGYPGYEDKLKGYKEKSGLNEAVISGIGKIKGNKTVIAVMDSHFMMGSMGSVVGEKVTLAIETATENKLPIVIFTTSGGARMQEGMFSLMQMAKTSAALGRHNAEGLLYVTVLTDPTTGGVTASFAMLGDIILAEPNALVGFAGQRVIEQTIKQKLPEGFQKAEFLLEHGFIDKIVARNDLKETLGNILLFHKEVPYGSVR